MLAGRLRHWITIQSDPTPALSTALPLPTPPQPSPKAELLEREQGAGSRRNKCWQVG